MVGKQLCIAVLLVATMLAAAAVAQDEKNEIGGMLGRTFISDQGIQGASYFDPVIHSGKGLTVEGEYARRFIVAPVYSLSAEALVVYNPDEDLNAGEYGSAVVPSDYKQLFVTPAARVNLFPTTAVSPWISLGAGFAHFSQGSSLVYGGTNPGKSTTSAVLESGFGLDVKVWRKLSVRLDVRDFWSGEPDFPLAPTGKSRQHNFFVGGGAFWRF
jgi:opacity protein-like surface antigen